MGALYTSTYFSLRRLLFALLIGMGFSILIAEAIPFLIQLPKANGTFYEGRTYTKPHEFPPDVGEPPLNLSSVLMFKPYEYEELHWHSVFQSAHDYLGALYVANGVDVMDAHLWPNTNSDNPPPVYHLYRDRFGWPFRSFTRDTYTAGWLDQYSPTESHVPVKESVVFSDPLNSKSTYHRGIEIPKALSGPGSSTYIPVRIIWTGLIFNSIFWGFIALVPGYCIRIARKAVRNRKRLCVACGYQVLDLQTCPECGNALRSIKRLADLP